MNQKKRDAAVRKANKTVKERHKAEPKAKVETADTGGIPFGEVAEGEPKAKVAKAPKAVKEGALPALPKMPSAKRSRKPRPQQPCACGCETPTAGLWAPGHDARAKGWAIRIERDICKLSDVPANERAGAKLMLEARKTGETGKIKIVKGKGNDAVPVAVNE